MQHAPRHTDCLATAPRSVAPAANGRFATRSRNAAGHEPLCLADARLPLFGLVSASCIRRREGRELTPKPFAHAHSPSATL